MKNEMMISSRIAYHHRSNRDSLLVILLMLFSVQLANAQRDSIQVAHLINEVNGRFIYPIANGVLLHPDYAYPYKHEHLVRDVTMVDGMAVQRLFSFRQDSFLYSVVDNQTIVQQAGNKRDSRTYHYHKDGRLERVLEGDRVDDLYLYDEDGAFIQRGTGGKLRRATKLGDTFEWMNVGQNQLDYILAYDTLGRTIYFKALRLLSIPRLDYRLEEYDWDGDRIVGQRIIENYQGGKADTTLVEFIYDDQGLLSMGRSRKSDDSSWSTDDYDTEIQFEPTGLVRISISRSNQTLLAVAFDEYDNWVEVTRPNITLRRQISYRERARRR